LNKKHENDYRLTLELILWKKKTMDRNFFLGKSNSPAQLYSGIVQWVKYMTADWLKQAQLSVSERSHVQKLPQNNNSFIMKILITILFLPFFLVSVGHASEWTLVWSDEFNYTGRPNSDKWNVDVGSPRNDEIGYFTDRTKNVRVEGGALIIEAHREKYSAFNYTTGSVSTRGKKNFKYGRFEIRAKMPRGKGSHVGIWMLGDNFYKVGWPRCGEIDIAEYVGRLPHTIHLYNHHATSSNPTVDVKTWVGKFTVWHPYDGFHIYAIEWDDTQIKYFIDNKQVATFNLDKAGTGSDNPFRKEFNLFLSYDLGDWGWAVDDSTLPAKLEIDYVRVYRATTSLAPINLLLLK
jgi:beta-glucanase (GH16 family)